MEIIDLFQSLMTFFATRTLGDCILLAKKGWLLHRVINDRQYLIANNQVKLKCSGPSIPFHVNLPTVGYHDLSLGRVQKVQHCPKKEIS